MAKLFTISSGHGKFVSGAADIVNEVTEARKIANRIGEILGAAGVGGTVYHDDTSRDQRTNINTIVSAHNRTERKADYSVHLNASSGRQQGDMGVEVLYVSDANRSHAQALSDAISAATGLKNRGAKKRTDLGFLNGTARPAFLIEAYFVNSVADVAKMDSAGELDKFCVAAAQVIADYVTGGKVYVNSKDKGNSGEASKIHAASWQWATSKGFIDGTRPQDTITREEMMTVLNRVYNDLTAK